MIYLNFNNILIMGQKRMDCKEIVRILAQRQENVTTKKSADELKSAMPSEMFLLAVARDLPHDAILATKPRSSRPLKTSKHTDDIY